MKIQILDLCCFFYSYLASLKSFFKFSMTSMSSITFTKSWLNQSSLRFKIRFIASNKESSIQMKTIPTCRIVCLPSWLLFHYTSHVNDLLSSFPSFLHREPMCKMFTNFSQVWYSLWERTLKKVRKLSNFTEFT